MHKCLIYQTIYQARPVKLFIILCIDVKILYMGQMHFRSKAKSSRAGLKSDNTGNINSIFNTKHAEISTKWYVLLCFSPPNLFTQAPQQSSPTIPLLQPIFTSLFHIHTCPQNLSYNPHQDSLPLYLIHLSLSHFHTRPSLQSPPKGLSHSSVIQSIQAASRTQ